MYICIYKKKHIAIKQRHIYKTKSEGKLYKIIIEKIIEKSFTLSEDICNAKHSLFTIYK